ncbi:SGNH/GDSL hydrolase family protein [Caulobacter sp. Root655]|uniref:SGNH/GDSL hydrolase family protein n=1 Tax=Caulobacter sp. Root655 TaxID=1736578 RepID=UPI001F2A4288|nr:SGNH/GDSL hydrolase family protein [Caulobacter sp. Root655]
MSRARLDRRAIMAGGLGLALTARAAQAQAQAPLTTPSQIPPQVPPLAPMSPQEARLRTDWPYLQRYAAENAVDRDLPAERRRVVFMGDSITEGWRTARPAFFVDHGFLGRGISGQVTAQMLVRFWPDVIALKPRAVHILAGINDIAENAGPYDPVATQANLQAMTVLAQANGVHVVLAAVTPALDFPWRPGLAPPAKVAALNDWLRAFAARSGAGLADYTRVLDDGAGGMRPGLAYDGVHPTAEGYAAMEPVTLTALTNV